jgi:adenosylhomocysteine nucleosidase
MMNEVIIMALKEEAPVLSHYKNVVFCGVGKVNAAATTAEIIQFFRPTRIINFGTAGGITVGSGLHRCGRFMQRDMLCEPLGFKAGQTPYEEEIVIDIGEGLLCSSGDNFVTGGVTNADLVDMEAFAIAKICKTRLIDFMCYKYVTDSADSNAAKDWNEMVAEGEKEYLKVVEQQSIKLYE